MRILAVLFMSAILTAQSISYNRRDIPTGAASGSAFVADFDRNGTADIGYLFSSPSNFFVTLLGRGNGTFLPPQNAALGSGGSVAVAIGDLNGDGIPDIASTDSNAILYVLIGNGDGTFQAAKTMRISGANGIVIGDFNRDGKADLAMLSGGTVFLYFGNGDGTFAADPLSTSTAGNGSTAVVAADFNHDGKLDIATVNSSTNNFSVLIGNGDGTFAPAVTYALDSTSSPEANCRGRRQWRRYIGHRCR